MVTVLADDGPRQFEATAGEQLWLSAAEVADLTGWVLKPEGFCKDDVCVPVPTGREEAYVNQDRIELGALWSLLGAPLARSANGDVWCLGEGADTRNDALLNLQAPDFTLPDFDGKPHSLSDFRRKRVLLLTWASW